MIRGIVTATLALALLGCGRERPAKAAAPDSARSAEEAAASAQAVDSLMAHVIPAAAVALAVSGGPGNTDSILAANGFTVDRYEATLYAIAADSTASQLYESALGR